MLFYDLRKRKLGGLVIQQRKVVLKKLSLLFIIVYVITSSACQLNRDDGFAIYLLARNIPATELAQIDINRVNLETKPIISNDDIISYDKTNHIIELTQAAYTRMQQEFPIPVNGTPFVVCVGNERIYTGAFWTPISSISYDGVVIMQPFDVKDTTIQITLGYPGSEFFTGTDPRADSRIMKALEEDHKIK
jgi:hypothetical protein